MKIGSNTDTLSRISSSLTLVSVAFGAFGAFLLGVFSAIPRSLWGTFDEKTLFSLAGSVTLLLTIGWAFFKLARPIVLIIYFFGVFLYCRFILGRKYYRNLRNQKVAMFQSQTGRRFLSSSQGRARTLIAQVILTVSFIWILFFSSPADRDLDNLTIAAFFVFYFSISILNSYRVGFTLSHKEFLFDMQGVKVLGAVALFICFSAGLLRVSTMMNQTPLELHTPLWTCAANSLFPVAGGDLFFLPESQSFVVIRFDGSQLSYRPENAGNLQSMC